VGPSHALDRASLLASLRAALEGLPEVLALALGGSDATGRTDEHSDLDLTAVVAVGSVEAVLAVVEAALLDLAPLRARLRVPEPAWHGFSQAFFALEGAPESLMVDLALIPVDVPPERRFLERERHGEAVVLFDPDGHLAARGLDRGPHFARAAARLTSLRARLELFGHMPAKALARGHRVEAASAFQGLLLAPLVELLRLRHAPERFDFGARYLDRDLPDEPRELLERLCLPGDTDGLARAIDTARARVAQELAELDAGTWGLDAGA
jgi:hypothetical protein